MLCRELFELNLQTRQRFVKKLLLLNLFRFVKTSSEKQLPKRKRGFEPPTLALAKLHSAIELLPRAVI